MFDSYQSEGTANERQWTRMKKPLAFIRVYSRLITACGNLCLGPQQNAVFPPKTKNSLLSNRNQPLQHAIAGRACALHIATHGLLRALCETCRNSLWAQELRPFCCHPAILGTLIAP
jgi:hypothetical protein